MRVSCNFFSALFLFDEAVVIVFNDLKFNCLYLLFSQETLNG